LTRKAAILLSSVLVSSLLVVGCTLAKDPVEHKAVATENAPEQTNGQTPKKQLAGNERWAEVDAVARAGDAVARAGGTHGKHTVARAGEARAQGNGTHDSAQPGEVTLEIEGSPQTEFSGTCTVGDKANKISGQVPKTFTYKPDGQQLDCKIRKQNPNSSGTLKVMFTADGHTNSVQQTSSQGGAITLQYDSDGGTNLRLTTSGSGAQVSYSSHVSVSQSNSCSGGNNCSSQSHVSLSQSNSISGRHSR
jgi:hypothetical protein